MKSLRVRRRPPAAEATPISPAFPWNTVATLGAGSVAAVDGRGAIFPYRRPVSIECWFGVGDRWLRGGSGDGVRQRRVDGLPIIETRQRAGDHDVVLTAWADESGDAKGRVIVELSNDTGDAAVVAIVVRPHGLQGAGSIGSVRVADTLIVADRVPLVDIGRQPGDVIVAPDPDRDHPAMYDLFDLDRSELRGDDALQSTDGVASLAALIPLTPGVDRQIQIFDGGEAASVAPAPLDNVLNGWKAHLEAAAEFELPRFPDHLPPSLVAGVVGAVADHGKPPADALWVEADDALLATALSGIGLHWGAAEILERLLDGVVTGRIPRETWVDVACAIAAGDRSSAVEGVLARHGEAFVAVTGEALSTVSSAVLQDRLVAAVERVHGGAAADDARSIAARPIATAAVRARRHGFGVDRVEGDASAGDPADEGPAFAVAAKILAAVDSAESYEPIVPLRSAAGTTWRWSRSACGDSPHARAALLIALRRVCLTESVGAVDLFPGADQTWLGQSAAFRRLPTAYGNLSCALRWHGARAALLWEFDDAVPDDVVITSSILDPSFTGLGASGEVLLAEPTHLSGRR